MKKAILALVDLSQHSSQVASLTAALADRMKLDILLLHCHDLVPLLAYNPVIFSLEEGTLEESRKEELIKIAEEIQYQLPKTHSGSKTKVNLMEISGGDLYTNVEAIFQRYAVEIIIMGPRAGSDTEHFLLGSDTLTVASKSPVPVFIAPRRRLGGELSRITFATSYDEQDVVALKYLISMARRIGAQLEILHVRQYKKDDERNPAVRSSFDQVCAKAGMSIPIRDVFGKHVLPRISRHMQQTGSDLLALSRVHHSRLTKFFRTGHIEKALLGHSMPLLIIPNEPTETDHSKPAPEINNIIF